MTKKLTWILLIALVVILILPSVAYADDGVDVSIDIWGDNPDTWLTLWGDNPDVWINGRYLGSLATQADLGHAMSVAVRNSVPNGRYGNSSSPGYQGYFGIKSNEAIVVIDHENPGKVAYSVYKGAGCGGSWGLSDGWPDFWSRRQFLGLLPILEAHQRGVTENKKAIESLNDKPVALENPEYGSMIETNRGELAVLSSRMDKLEKFVDEQGCLICELEQEAGVIRTTTYVLSGFIILLVAAIASLSWRLRQI